MRLYEVEQLEMDTGLQTRAWVRYVRRSSAVVFLQCYDGTTTVDMQLVVPKDIYFEIKRGDFIEVDATKVKSKGTQEFELLVKSLKVRSQPEKYPLEKRDSSLETLREIPQYRTKTLKFSTLMKLRSKIELSIMKFYSQKSFIKITPPLITPSDCEGAGEVFSLGQEFFKKEAFLTVSSQMYLEAMVRSFSQVYCLAPAFRADPSLSPRHLAEFWMLEVEILADDVSEIITEALGLIRFIGQELLESKDLLSILDKDLAIRIEDKLKEEFKIISYQEGSGLIGQEIKGSKEEKELMTLLGSSLVLTDFPSDQKPFYMKRDGTVTKSFDILVKDVGEVVGGSLREESSAILKERMTSSLTETLAWYLEMRDVDKISTGGFGLGFERILMYYLELESIKDIIPFPRWMERMDL